MRKDFLIIHLFAIVGFLAVPGRAWTQVSMSQAGSEISGDFKYLVNNTQLDLEDIVTSPLYVASPDSALRSPKFYLVLGGAGALWGGSFALDQTMRSHLRSMSSSDADLLQDVSYASVPADRRLVEVWGSVIRGSQPLAGVPPGSATVRRRPPDARGAPVVRW